MLGFGKRPFWMPIVLKGQTGVLGRSHVYKHFEKFIKVLKRHRRVKRINQHSVEILLIMKRMLLEDALLKTNDFV